MDFRLVHVGMKTGCGDQTIGKEWLKESAAISLMLGALLSIKKLFELVSIGSSAD